MVRVGKILKGNKGGKKKSSRVSNKLFFFLKTFSRKYLPLSNLSVSL